MSERTEHGIRVGAIEVTADAQWSNGSAVSIRAGDVDVNIVATPKGRRAYLTITTRGRTRLALSAFVDGRWWQPGDKP